MFCCGEVAPSGPVLWFGACDSPGRFQSSRSSPPPACPRAARPRPLPPRRPRPRPASTSTSTSSRAGAAHPAPAKRQRRPMHHRQPGRHVAVPVGALPVSNASGSVVRPQPAAHSCHAKGSGPYSEPDPKCTPGALNPAVTQATIDRTICMGGWTERFDRRRRDRAGEAREHGRLRRRRLDRATYEYDRLVVTGARRRGQRPADRHPSRKARRTRRTASRRASPNGVRRRGVARGGPTHHRDRMDFLRGSHGYGGKTGPAPPPAAAYALVLALLSSSSFDPDSRSPK